MIIRYPLLILGIFLLFVISACNGTPPAPPPTVTPTPSAEGSRGVLWDINFVKESGSPFKVTKTIWKVIETADRRFDPIGPGQEYDITSGCRPEGPEGTVNIDESADYIEFERGGYIACDDIGIPDEIGRLEDLISTDDCVADEPCMRPPMVLVEADVRYSAAGSHYSLFYYPQTASSTVDDESLALAFQATGDSHTIDWQIYGSTGAPLAQLAETLAVPVPARPGLNNFDFISIGARREAPEDLNFTYNVNGSSAIGGVNFAAETEFEFFPGPVTFYMGDRNAELEPGAKLQLHSLDFDPADSCGGCN